MRLSSSRVIGTRATETSPTGWRPDWVSPDQTMPTITEVRFAHENGALAETMATLEDPDIRVLPETSTDPERDVYVFTFEDAGPDAVERALRADGTVSGVHPMPAFEERPLWGVEFAPETELLAPRVTREGGFVVDARSTRCGEAPCGWRERWLLPDREAIHDIWMYARETGFEFEVLDLHARGSVDTEYLVRDVLTDGQREALLAAYEQGYFADPREASLEEVADSLDYSPSAVGGRIKRGMKALVDATLVVDGTRQ